jgi:hypothetical protein
VEFETLRNVGRDTSVEAILMSPALENVDNVLTFAHAKCPCNRVAAKFTPQSGNKLNNFAASAILSAERCGSFCHTPHDPP